MKFGDRKFDVKRECLRFRFAIISVVEKKIRMRNWKEVSFLSLEVFGFFVEEAFLLLSRL